MNVSLFISNRCKNINYRVNLKIERKGGIMNEKWREQAKTLWQRVNEGFERGMELAAKSAEAFAEKAGETAQMTGAMLGLNFK